MRLKEVKPKKEYDHSEIWDYVYERDNGRCQICGKGRMLEQHHIVMKSLGGKTVSANLILVCNFCHTNRCHGINRVSVEYMQAKVASNERRLRERLI